MLIAELGPDDRMEPMGANSKTAIKGSGTEDDPYLVRLSELESSDDGEGFSALGPIVFFIRGSDKTSVHADGASPSQLEQLRDILTARLQQLKESR